MILGQGSSRVHSGVLICCKASLDSVYSCKHDYDLLQQKDKSKIHKGKGSFGEI